MSELEELVSLRTASHINESPSFELEECVCVCQLHPGKGVLCVECWLLLHCLSYLPPIILLPHQSTFHGHLYVQDDSQQLDMGCPAPQDQALHHL